MDFAAGVYEAPSPPVTPYPLTNCNTCKLYTYSHREGGGGRANQKEG